MRSSFLNVSIFILLLSTITGCATTPVLARQTGPPGSPGLIFVGPYANTTPYVLPDVVTYRGSSFVALKPSTGIPPLGDTSSAATWSVLAQAGSDGAQGLAGPQGPQGLPGVEGVAGMTGAMGSPGTGSSHLAGRRYGVQGDSISASNEWQPIVTARTGMILKYQEARPGRGFNTAFECYGNPKPGSTLGVYDASYVFPSVGGTCGQYGNGIANGTTLTQNLANVDLLIVSLGTNDSEESVGELGDATNSGTFYGNMRWVIETYLTAKPSLRLVMVTVQYNTFTSTAKAQQFANAAVSYGGSVGVPVINMFALGGVNAITASTLTVDGTHPNSFGYLNFYGPVIAQGVEQVF